MNRSRTSGILAALLFAALLRTLLALAAAVLVGPTAFSAPDTPSYVEPARALLESARFDFAGHPEIGRTPGYPILLSFALVTPWPTAVTVALQILLSLATVFLTFTITSALFRDDRLGVYAAVGMACEPLSVVYTAQLLTETLFAAVLMTAVALLLQYHRNRGWVPLLIAAFGFALAAFVRPIAYYLPFVATTWLIAAAVLDTSHRGRRLRHAPAFFFIAFVPLLAWQIRNDIRADYSRFSAIEDEVLYFYHAAAAEAAATSTPYLETRDRFGFGGTDNYLRAHPAQTDWSRAERYQWMRSEALHIIRRHPGQFAKNYASGWGRVLADPGAADLRRTLAPSSAENGWLATAVDRGFIATVIEVAHNEPLLIAAAVPLTLLWGLTALAAAVGIVTVRHRTEAWLLLMIALYLFLVSGGPAALARFRHPIMPLIWIIAAAGVNAFFQRRNARVASASA